MKLAKLLIGVVAILGFSVVSASEGHCEEGCSQEEPLPYAMTVYLYDSLGNPVANVYVKVSADSDAAYWIDQTDASGRASFPDFEIPDPGPDKVQIYLKGLLGASCSWFLYQYEVECQVNDFWLISNSGGNPGATSGRTCPGEDQDIEEIELGSHWIKFWTDYYN